MAKQEKAGAPEEQQQAAEGASTETAIISAASLGDPFAGLDLGSLGLSEDDLKELTGLNAIGSSEIRIPYATLIAKPTKEHKVGQIVFPDGTVINGQDGDTISGISVLQIQPVRVYFPSPFNPNNSFICRSIDGRVGHTDGEYAGQKCDTCQFAQYPKEGGASPCRDQRLLLLSKPDGGLFHMQVGGVGVRVWKDFMSAQIFHLLPKAKNLMCSFNLTMAVKIVDTNFGPFPAIDFRLDQRAPFLSKERIGANLTALKAYKEFEREHLESAALQTKASMAAGQDEAASGQNGALF